MSEGEHTTKWDLIREKIQAKTDFMQHAWKPLLATIFGVILLFDFMIAPAWTGVSRVPLETVLELTKDLSVEERKMIIEYSYRQWKPMTLSDGVGLFYLSMGSILTGVAVFGFRGKEK